MDTLTGANDNFTPDEETEMDRAALKKECAQLEIDIEIAKRRVQQLQSVLEQRRELLESIPQKAS